jgi:NAD(P)H-hydrate epimerase
MTFPLGREEHWSSGLVPLLSEELSRFQAVVAGPGMGRDQGAREALEAYLALEDRPDTCFDADALYWLAESPELRSRLRSGDVVTPHPLEAARLLGEKTAHIQADRQAAVGDLASSLGCVAVLKGAGTLVAAPERRIRFCPVAEPALAVAGAGDVLAGLLGAALARGMAPLDAACFAVYVHGFTGSLLGRSNRERGLLASEIADALPRGLKEMRTNANGQRHHEPRGYNPLP